MVTQITRGAPNVVAIYCLLLILVGATASVAGARQDRESEWRRRYRTSPVLLMLRVLGLPLAVLFALRTGPRVLQQESVASLIWQTLTFSVGVIIPMAPLLAALTAGLTALGVFDGL